jgi:hypothetical protein
MQMNGPFGLVQRRKELDADMPIHLLQGCSFALIKVT